MEEKVLIVLLFIVIIAPIALLVFFATKKRVMKWYYRGLRLATGYYFNKKVINTIEGREYIQYDNAISCWLYTYLFPTVYKFLVILIPVCLLFVRIPNSNGYIIKYSDLSAVEKVAILDTTNYKITTEELLYNANTNSYSLREGVQGIVLGEYVEKAVTLYTIPGIIVRSVSASIHVFIDKCTSLLEQIY